MEKIIKGMANASEAIDNNFEELSQAKTSHDTRLTTVEGDVDLLKVSNIYDQITWSETGSFSRRVVYIYPLLRLVYIHAWVDVTDPQTQKWICQIPAPYRPLQTRSFPWASKSAHGVVEISTLGEIVAHAISGTTSSHFRVNGVIGY